LCPQIPGLFRIRRSSSDPGDTATCAVDVVGPFIRPSTMAVAVVTSWDAVATRTGISAGAAMGATVAPAGRVAAINVPSCRSVASGTGGPMVVGSDAVFVGCTGGTVGGGGTRVVVGDVTAVEVAG
ncbi:MAG: hypothetical protein ACE5JL_08075, partial [Dehalococcoidia bacterium]